MSVNSVSERKSQRDGSNDIGEDVTEVIYGQFF